MILSKTAKVKLWSSNMKPLLALGYKGKRGDVIDVNIEDLPKGSSAEIEILCDMCYKNKMVVPYQRYNRVIKETGSYVCKECSPKKVKQTCLKRYGQDAPAKSDVVKEKMKQTSLERYGVDNYGKTKECHEKIKQTCLEKYGVEHFAKVKKSKTKRLKQIWNDMVLNM